MALDLSQRRRSITRTDVLEFLLLGRAYVALLLVVAVFTVLTDNFLSAGNLEIMGRHVAINGIAAIGMTFIILTAGIDLGVGSVAALVGMIGGSLINNGIRIESLDVILYPSIPMVILICLGCGALLGLLNGTIITRFGVAPFIATLGMFYIARGLAGMTNNGGTFPNLVGREELGNTGFETLGAGKFLGLGYSIWIMFALAIVAHLVLTRRPFGRHVIAVGGNTRSAKLSGVRINRTTVMVYVIGGLCYATVGLILASQLRAAHPASGNLYELNAIAAVVLGGTSLAGGRGSIRGTIIGAFVIGVGAENLVQRCVGAFVERPAVELGEVACDHCQNLLRPGSRDNAVSILFCHPSQMGPLPHHGGLSFVAVWGHV